MGKKDSIDKQGKFNSRMERLVPAAKVIKFDNDIPSARQDILIHYVKSALTAIPVELQEFFIHHNGVIRVTPNLETQCDLNTIESLKEKELSGKSRLDSCYRFLRHNQAPVSGLSLFIRDTPAAIGHGTVRGFGYLFADFFSHVSIDGKKTKYHYEMLPSMRSKIVTLHNLYLQDLESIQSWQDTGAGSPIETLAEAFDSLLCNNSAPHDENEILRIKNQSLTSQEIAEIFSEQRNTLRSFRSLFSQSFFQAQSLIGSILKRVRKFVDEVKPRNALRLTEPVAASLGETDIAGSDLLTLDGPSINLPNQNSFSDLNSSNSISNGLNANNSLQQPDSNSGIGDLDNLNFNDFQFENPDNPLGNSSTFNNTLNNQPNGFSNQNNSNNIADPDKNVIIINNYNGGIINLNDQQDPQPDNNNPNLQDPFGFNNPQIPNIPLDNNPLNFGIPDVPGSNIQPQTPSNPQIPSDPQNNFNGPQIDSQQNIQQQGQPQNNDPQSGNNQNSGWVSWGQQMNNAVNNIIKFEQQKMQSWTTPSFSNPGSYMNSLSNYGNFYQQF